MAHMAAAWWCPTRQMLRQRRRESRQHGRNRNAMRSETDSSGSSSATAVPNTSTVNARLRTPTRNTLPAFSTGTPTPPAPTSHTNRGNMPAARRVWSPSIVICRQNWASRTSTALHPIGPVASGGWGKYVVQPDYVAYCKSKSLPHRNHGSETEQMQNLERERCTQTPESEQTTNQTPTPPHTTSPHKP